MANLRLNIGVKHQVIKTVMNADGPDPDEVDEDITDVKRGVCSTNPVEIDNIESVKPTSLMLKENLDFAFRRLLDKQTGSGWSIKNGCNV